MARTLTTTQSTNLELNASRPIFLVKWAWNGATEYLSCSGAVTFDGNTYTAGGVNIQSIEDSNQAILSLPFNTTRMSELTSSNWRGASCVIYAVPAAPGDTPTYSVGDELTLLDGIIESARFANETIQITAKNKYFTGVLAPRFVFNDISTTIPPVGKSYVWDDETYDYTVWLQSNTRIQRLVRPGTNPQFVGRPTTTEVNEFNDIPKTGYDPISGEAVHIPIIYGRVSVPGYVLVDAEFEGAKVITVGWCMGEIASIEQVFINDLPIPYSGVGVRHYRGTTYQTVDSSVRDTIATSPQYDEDMVLDLPQGSIGIAYSVFTIDTSIINAAPQFRAIIQGRIITDEDSAGNGDPFYDSVSWAFDFVNSGAVDLGPNSRTISLNGDASISSPSIGLELDGTGDSATISVGSPIGDDVGEDNFSLEVKFLPRGVSSPADTETIIQHGSTTSSPQSRSIRIDRYGNSIKLYISTNGTSYDVANGETTTSGGVFITSDNNFDLNSPLTPVSVVLDKFERQWSLYINGLLAIRALTPNTSPETYNGLYNAPGDWTLGTGDGGDFTGEIIGARLTLGYYRYGGYHTANSTISVPWSDYGKYNTYAVYSNKPAHAWKDLAENAFFGLGATTTGVTEAVAYGDELMDCGEARCRIGLAITDPRRVEQWLDQLAGAYANCLWFPEGSNLKIVPDRIGGDNATGQTNIVTDGTFDGSPTTAWTFDSPTQWTITGGALVGSTATSRAYQTLTVTSSYRYKISIEILATSPTPSGSVFVEIDGTTIFSGASTVGTHTGYFTANASSVQLAIGGFVFTGSVDNVSVTEVFYQVTADMILGR